MSIGASIRKMFGPHERKIADLYRQIYVNLEDLVDKIANYAGQPQRILEVGCGEGAMTEQLVKTLPQAHVTAIDITPSVGRLFEGNRDNVRFIQQSLGELILSEPDEKYDLVIISDVIHHVASSRDELLHQARSVVASNGQVVIKDMAKSLHPIFWLGYFSDYFITGDKHVAFHTIDEFRGIISGVFGESSIERIGFARPWKVNVIFFIRPSPV